MLYTTTSIPLQNTNVLIKISSINLEKIKYNLDEKKQKYILDCFLNAHRLGETHTHMAEMTKSIINITVTSLTIQRRSQRQMVNHNG